MTGIQSMIHIVVVDDHLLFRQGISEILSSESDLRVVGQCGGTDAIGLVSSTRPDVVLLDSNRSGIEAERILRGMLVVSPDSKVIVVTVHDQPRLVSTLIAAGADAYVLKSATRDELLATIRKVSRASGHIVLSVSRETLQGLGGVDRPLLSRRECEVLSLVAGGMRNSQIARQLYISEGTVKRHLTNAYTKLGAISRIDAIKKAVSLGFVSYDDMFDADG